MRICVYIVSYTRIVAYIYTNKYMQPIDQHAMAHVQRIVTIASEQK